ncbi:MAG: RecX family transcriptional regulator, partial [Solirubrobacterales bacterium]|nr:RecX family transcriptional regulator [Solirubrobacterales bacterium]
RLFVQDKRELEQWGSERIRQGLLARGLDRETIEAALVDGQPSGDYGQPRGEYDQPRGECEQPRDELERALTLLSRRFPSPPQNRRERDRALGVLVRKGYEPELALDALRAYARGG